MTENNNGAPVLYIIDGYGLIYRSYFAFINRPLRDMEGKNVSAVFGFFNTLFMLIRDYNPNYLVVAMDTAAPTFRHDLYPEYKANRDKAPEDLHAQVPMIKEILDTVGVPQIGKDGWEADDVIASLIRSAELQGVRSVMVTGDKDLLQLVSPTTSALRPPLKGEKTYRLFGPDEVLEEFGIRADQIVDYLALIGDSSDNVPGVAGIGPKGAVKLLQEYDSLQGIYEHVADCSKAVKERLESSREMAFLSQVLVRLKTDAISVDSFETDQFRLNGVDWRRAVPYFESAQARSLVSAAKSFAVSNPTSASVPEPIKASLLEKNEQHGLSQAGRNWNEKGLYHAVESLDELEDLLQEMSRGGIMAFDFETTGLDEMLARPVGFSFTNRPFEAWYVPLIAGGVPVLPENEVKAILKKHVVDKKIYLVGQNLKYDYKVMVRWGITDAVLHFDTMVAAWVLDAASGLFNMDYLAEKYLNGYQTIHFTDVVTEKDGQFSEVPLDLAVAYAAEDADITWRLYEIFKEMLHQRGMESLFNDLEMPLVKILSTMELAGVRVDSKKLEEFDLEVIVRIAAIEKEIYETVGHEFNINSTKQLQEVLFVERGLPTGKKNKTGFSTATETLEQLAAIDVIPRLILQNRGLVKLKNTYIDSLPKMVNPETGRIHTSYLQTGTATGRLSSRNPNLQNIPIRSDDGRRIRNAFVPSEGHVFLSADYSQIELVVLAHMADDKGLKEAFLKGEDVHSHTAASIFGIHPQLVAPEQRRIAKTINFGVMYGMSAFRLSNELQIPQKQAKVFIEDYFARFNGVQAFMQRIRENAEVTGKVATLLGREREVPEIRSSNKMEKSGGERVVVNTVIQGTAADIMKMAMLRVVRSMKEQGFLSKLLLQVHDELIFEVPTQEVAQMQVLVRQEMEHAVELSIPLRVSMEIGSSWGDLH
jgi:DNA polymerase I